MSATTDWKYTFDGMPIDPVPPGTNLLVTGPSLGGVRELCMQLIASDDEGLLLLSADLDAAEAIETYERINGRFDHGRMGLVDCTKLGEDNRSGNVRSVSSPGDLTGIGINFAQLYEGLYGAGVERVRTGLYTLTTVLPYVDDIKPIFRFLHTLSGRIRTADGLGVCAIDPETQDERVLGNLAQPFDGRLELRQTDGAGCEVRLCGLSAHDDDWRDYDLLA